MNPIFKDSKEIAEYIFENSIGDIDQELIEEQFRDCQASLREVEIKDLKFANQDNHILSEKKQKSYNKKPAENAPPIVIEKNVIIDGHHRVRAAIFQNKTKILAYCIEDKD